MDNTSAQSSAAQPSDKKTSSSNPAKRKIWLAGTSLLFIVLLAGYLIYWFMVLRYQEYTDDAYVVGLQVPIVAQTTGNVTQVNFENTDLVHAGDVLVVLDKTNAELAYAQARHDLAATVRQTQELYFNRDQLGAVIAQKQVMLNQAQNDYARRSVLGQRGTISKEDLQHSREAVEEAQASLNASVQQLNASVQQLNATKALLHGTGRSACGVAGSG